MLTEIDVEVVLGVLGRLLRESVQSLVVQIPLRYKIIVSLKIIQLSFWESIERNSLNLSRVNLCIICRFQYFALKSCPATWMHVLSAVCGSMY